MKNQECISSLIGMTGAIKEIREDQEYINTIKHAIKILELEEVSSDVQPGIMPGEDLEQGSGWRCVKDGLPKNGGTVATWNGREVAWMYYNPDTKRFHPVRGWGKSVGCTDITHYLELPAPSGV